MPSLAQRGRIKLLKKVRKKEVVILPSDKGKGIVVTTMEMYARMGQDHTTKDREIQWRELKQCQAEMNANSRALARIFRVGESPSLSNQLRCFDNATSWAQHAPNMRAVPKTHKDPNKEGHPQSRPVVAADSGITTNGSEILSRLLKPISRNTDSCEVLSTEEMLRTIDDTSESTRNRNVCDLIVASMDVKALYSSLDQQQSARDVAAEFLHSQMDIQDVDVRAAVVYIASTCTKKKLQKDRLDHLIPVRLHKRGAKPGLKTKELSGGMPRSKLAKEAMKVLKEKADQLPPGTTRDPDPQNAETK
jgi:hypothetical protein